MSNIDSYCSEAVYVVVASAVLPMVGKCECAAVAIIISTLGKVSLASAMAPFPTLESDWESVVARCQSFFATTGSVSSAARSRFSNDWKSERGSCHNYCSISWHNEFGSCRNTFFQCLEK